jgi:hypothetical protein
LKKGYVASKLINSAETIAVVMSYVLVTLTDIHLSIDTEEIAKWKAKVILVSQILISAVSVVKLQRIFNLPHYAANCN